MASSSSSNIQKIETISSMAMEQLKHFSHKHLLSLVQLQPDHINENSDREDEEEEEDDDEDKDDIAVPEDHYFGRCKMCEEEIYLFHLCYYSCEKCDYSLHKFCAELPETQHNHPLHPDHDLMLSEGIHIHDPDFKDECTVDSDWRCTVCEIIRNKCYSYHCSICFFHMDIVCATMSEQKMSHPSHPHQLQRYFRRMISHCNACSTEHSGTFYQCTTCCFMIHLDCALLPSKLLIQKSTNGSFSHSHLLTLTYSFPFNELKAKFFPRCRVCDNGFVYKKWHYRCNKCRYYVNVDCATPRDAFTSSILMPAGEQHNLILDILIVNLILTSNMSGFGKTYKNFKDDDHPDLIRCPFPDESVSLLMHHFINKGELVTKRKIDGEMFCHPHPLILVDSLLNGSVSLHDPMKKVELLCDGCVRPITNEPFYKCSQDDCDFVLHEWCTRLPSQVQDHHDHPQHKLVLLPKIPEKLLGVFKCEICLLHCNGFAYGCMECNYYVDINCGFLPDVITHEAHPNHLLQRFKTSSGYKFCKACRWWINVGFHCRSCNFCLHSTCALLLPRTIRHKYDKHPLSLRYGPAENHSSEYFCDICEDELNPGEDWFYHCSTCASSMHTACAPLKLQCEQSTYFKYKEAIFKYINVKFGGTIEIRYHPHPLTFGGTIEIRYHPHPLTFVQGINADGQCTHCDKELQYEMIIKCSQCKFAIHYECVRVRKYLDGRIVI